ncbi:MAG: hypothetical protein ACE5GE_08365 [Phycisphaerae bacterium]
MSEEPESLKREGGIESYGFVQIFRSFQLAVRPTNLVLAAAALVATLAWGGVLDAVWKASDAGVPANAIGSYVRGEAAGVGTDPADDVGLFEVWRTHTRWCLESAMASLLRRSIWGEGTAGMTGMPALTAGRSPMTSPTDLGGQPVGFLPSLGLLCSGTTWMVRSAPGFSVLLLAGTLGIWALFGGALCRVSAVQFARDERLGLGDALTYARQHYWGGYFLSPVLPALMVAVIGLFLALGGVFLRIPLLGDVVGGLLFGLALIGGLAAGLILLGSFGGGSLFWPTVAAEGSESLDAVSRSFNYVAVNPWRTIFYSLVGTAYAGLCYLFVRLLAYLTLAATHAFVSFGTAPFGWWKIGEGTAATSKLELIWAAPAFDQLQPVLTAPGGLTSVSAWLIGIWVSLVLLMVWAFLASFYFSASTVVYFLLRRDTDSIDLEDVYMDTYEEGEYEAADKRPPEPTSPAPQSGVGVQLTVEGKEAAGAAASQGDQEDGDEA